MSTFRPVPTGDPPAPLSPARRWELLGSLMETAPEVMAIFRLADLRGEYFNEAALARLTPHGSAEPAQLTLPELVGLGSWQRLESEILPQARVLGRWSGELDLRDAWGSEFRARVTLRLHVQSRGDGFVCLHAREMEMPDAAASGHSTDRQLLHALLDHAPDAIYFKDSASRFLRMSRAHARKLGLADPREAIGRTDFDFFSAQHASAAYADEQTILRTGQPIIDLEEKETWEDGRIAWVNTTKLPLYDADGRIVGTFGISHDITARKRADAERRELETQLQLGQKLESIGRLAAGVAHEINTPTQFIADNLHFLTDAFAKLEAVLAVFRALRTAAEATPACAAAASAAAQAETEAELDYLVPEIPRCLQQSLDGLARVARIVASLKEFAHPNSPDLAPADLNRAIETSVVVSRHEWKYVAQLATELDPALPSVPCIVDEFNQVILNLVINSAHAIADALKERGGTQGRIVIRTRAEPDWAVVEIEDTGTGIAPGIRDRIFEPFFTTKPPGKGTGQGLAVVRTVIVNHHHGRIDLESAPGQGSKFILRLPLAATPPSPPPTTP